MRFGARLALPSPVDRATAWLLAHKILLPGVTTLERFVVSVRARVEARLYQLLTRGITVQQKDQLQRLGFLHRQLAMVFGPLLGAVSATLE